MKAAVIADDLTGALEMGALLAARRLRTLVTMQWEVGRALACAGLQSHPEAVVIDTESRNLPPQQAAERVQRVAQMLSVAGSIPVFKKVDSTLRGPIGAELTALAAGLGRQVVLTPAYPQLGRIVRDGRLLVHGVDVSETEFARDARWPVRDSQIAKFVGPEVRVCDAETEGDLQAIVAAAGPDVVLAGSGGLGRTWVESLPLGSAAAWSRRPCERVLVVCGSHHPVSLAQAERAALAGIEVILPPRVEGDPAVVLRQVTAAAWTAVEQLCPDLMIVFGGETAAALLSGMGVYELRPVGEVLTGIVASRAVYRGKEMMVVTKAGGFGGTEVVDEILRNLQ